jgi:phage shock protein PspC (stress-responsive transcriptional regulator)
MISGICAGLANYWKVDVSLVRVATVAATLLTSGFLIVLYVILHFIIPAEPVAEIN